MIKDILLAGIYAAGAAGFCAFYFNTNKFDVLWGALLGALGWIVYVIIQKTGGSAMYAYFAGAFSVHIRILDILLKSARDWSGSCLLSPGEECFKP